MTCSLLFAGSTISNLRRTKLKDPDGNTHTYSYSNTATNKGLASVTHAMPAFQQGLGSVSYDRDSHGRLSALVHGFNAVRQEYTYDAHWRLSGYSIHSYYTGGSGSPLHQESYTYDPLDRRTRVDYGVQTGAGGAVAATRREWGYDSAGRLTREERFPSASGTTADWGRTWGYDAAGNRNSEARYDGSSTSTFSRTHNAWNQAPSAVHGDLLAWDHEGNLVVSHNEARSYGWDRANRLTLVSGEMESGEYEDVYYGYDPSGRLIDRERLYDHPEKRYYADGLSPILVKRWDSSLNSGTGGWKTLRTAMIVPGVIGHVAAEREATAWNGSGVPTAFTDRHFHYDPLGNTVLETGSNATVLARTDMEAYGEMVRESNASGSWAVGNGATNRPRQTTKETDPDTGLRWFGARWYDPGMGAWLGVAPFRLPVEQSYSAFSNSPTTQVDSDGRRDWGPYGLGGKCCNLSGANEWALVAGGQWVLLKPGECTGFWTDCDGMTCGGAFYAVSIIGGTCKTPGKDDWWFKDMWWTPTGQGCSARSPGQQGGPDLPPDYKWRQ